MRSVGAGRITETKDWEESTAMTLNDKLAVVTGAGSGIGRATALALSGRGARLAVVDLDADAAAESVELITRAGGSALAFRADTSKADEIDLAVARAVSEFGPLEIMVNNAGILDGYFNVDEVDEAVWRRVIEIDLTGVFLGCKRGLQEMLPLGRGRIINMASVAGLNGTGGGAAYVAAKHGVVGLTRQMAVVYSARGITINAVCPGPISTGLRQHSQQILGPGVADMSNRGVAVNEDQIREVVPAGRRGTVEDVASAVCYLASDEAAYITGHTMVVDGGWRAR
jgi:NAD(P)-dependent dehydrogenase (short-subunit alcohol dehydrogenase family)